MSSKDKLDLQPTNVLPSSPADRLKLRTMISEATYCLQRIDDERAAAKDIVTRIHEDFGITKKAANKMIRTLYKQDYQDRVAEEEEFELLYEGLFDTKIKGPTNEADGSDSCPWDDNVDLTDEPNE